MPSRTAIDQRNRIRAVWIASAIAIILAIAGIWWGVSASSAKTGSTESMLPEDTSMGVVELITDDLEPMRAYYVDAVGLEVISEDAEQISLGHNGEQVLSIRVEDRPQDSYANAGLYHSAILYPDEQALAQVIANIATVAPQSFGGSADHAVSLAFYFADPDGNGLELYVDTPPETWVWEDGLEKMGSAPLDPNLFIEQHLGTAPSSEQVTMGHVHLRVGNLQDARAFYADTLGFAVTAEADGALFYAAGGYHHHVATNTWMSQGADERPESQGLGSITVNLGSPEALAEVADRLTAAEIAFEQGDGIITVNDPWGNTVMLLA
ncbi:VOC family protein [Gulosibacter chungangensis]|uniref:VOC family protein n=1 Tax=Gulosibacter chungangensis TaxID=979746 RepID=A0A7J5BCM0_9MICO|nr:VOC family protein [Gulosibacter chungangensis]KAB1643930.1 VOC family protein [Gulosibacter chungangensis]